VKQILQSLKTGITELADVPTPALARGQILIGSSLTLVSAGTERMLVEFGKAGWIGKARRQPERVQMVFDKMRTDGLMPTLEAVFRKLDQPLPLGYCQVGHVVGLGAGVVGFNPGERVVSNGKHAEAVCVPAHLCAKIPEGVSDDAAAFTVLGAIALQGIRLIQPTLGEAVVVSGLGLIGLMAVQLLRAQGCRVLGLDYTSSRVELARSLGVEAICLQEGMDPLAAISRFSRGIGVDAVLITASTSSSEPIRQAAQMCRKRGRIVLVGVTGLELSRADFYEKELTFQVSCSYGPGRYDPNYEEKGQDYPVGFVRWTEQRNFEAVLDMMAAGRIDVGPLISHRFAIGDAVSAYQLLAGSEPSMGILLEYPGVQISQASQTIEARELHSEKSVPGQRGQVVISFIGAGNYAAAALIPAFRAAGARLRMVACQAGVSGWQASRKFGFTEVTTDTERIFSDKNTQAVVVTTRHESHARLVLRTLEAGKNLFVEKPLCLTLAELHQIEAAKAVNASAMVMVGFNRRFAPQIRKIKSLLEGVSGPKTFVMTVNAGSIPLAHWTHDPEVGGGRIIGEACHFIDLLRFLANASIERSWSVTLDSSTRDTVTLQLVFADGSAGTIHYFSNGHKSFPKERLEIFAEGKILQLDNFRKLRGYGWSGFKKMNLWRQDKGQQSCAAAFLDAVKSGTPAPIPFEEILEVSRISIELANSRQQRHAEKD